MKAAVRLIALGFVLIAAAQVAARETSQPIGMRSLPAVAPCKNHYILDEPCGVVATEATLVMPGAIAVDGAGNVYFSSPNIVYKIDAAGLLTRVAGNGSPGFSGDGGPATEATLNFPWDYAEMDRDPIDFSELLGPLALDSAGNLYIGDAYNNRVRRVDPNGIIDTVAGSGARGSFGTYPGNGIPTAAATLWWPQGVAIDPLGHLLIADSTGALLKLLDDGTIAMLTTNNCGPRFREPGLCAPEGIAVNAAGDVFVPDAYCRIRRVGAGGDVRTVAGDERPDLPSWAFTCGYSGDGGPATPAALSNVPFSVAIDTAGNLFIADTYNDCIRAVGEDGNINTVAGRCGHPGNAASVGSAFVAGLRRPHGVAVDSFGNLYIADTGNNCIRKVTPDGLMTTIAGHCDSYLR